MCLMSNESSRGYGVTSITMATRSLLPRMLAITGLALTASLALNPSDLVLGELLATGNFGACHWAHHGSALCVAKHATPNDARAAVRREEPNPRSSNPRPLRLTLRPNVASPRRSISPSRPRSTRC